MTLNPTLPASCVLSHATPRAGLFEEPLAPAAGLTRLDTPAHRALAYEAAAQSIVVLTNANATLPLALGVAGARVALVGAFMVNKLTPPAK